MALLEICLTRVGRISLADYSGGGSTAIGPTVWPMRLSKWAEMLNSVDGSDFSFWEIQWPINLLVIEAFIRCDRYA